VPKRQLKPADYVLFVDKKPVGLIVAKREDQGYHLIEVEDQSTSYANAKLKYCDHKPLAFVYESTGAITRFTDYRDPKPRSREVFTFHRPETFLESIKHGQSLRSR
jgi:type I restriction enzyme R subunit